MFKTGLYHFNVIINDIHIYVFFFLGLAFLLSSSHASMLANCLPSTEGQKVSKPSSPTWRLWPKDLVFGRWQCLQELKVDFLSYFRFFPSP